MDVNEGEQVLGLIFVGDWCVVCRVGEGDAQALLP